LSTVVTSKPREGIDFFPLTVDVEERMYAAGKIPGSFFRREGRPGEQAVLTCRLTDRPLRPSFPEGFRNEVQVIATILGADLETQIDYSPDVFDAVADEARSATTEAMQIADKTARNRRLDEIEDVALATLQGNESAPGPFAGREVELRRAFRSLQKQVVRQRI